METDIQEIRPVELSDSIESGEVTLVLGAPCVGKSHHVAAVGHTVTRLPAAAAVDDDELVIVDDFATAICDLTDEAWSTYGDERSEKSLLTRAGGAAFVTRPRSFDWLCRSESDVSAAFVEAVDTVLMVRTPPAAGTNAIETIRDAVASRRTSPLGDERRAQLGSRIAYPTYRFESDPLRARLGWYDATVTPAAFLSLTSAGSTPVLVGADVRRMLQDRDVSIEPLGNALVDIGRPLVPSGDKPGRRFNERAPPVAAAASLIAAALVDDANWFGPLVRCRPLPAAAEALEAAFDLPPGTVGFLRTFAAEPARGAIRDRLAARADDEAAIADFLEDRVEAFRTIDAVFSSLEAVSTSPETYGSSPLVSAWQSEGLDELRAAATAHELPDRTDGSDGSADRPGTDPESDVDSTALLEALDGGIVVLTGTKASGKRRLASRVAAELSDWGATIMLPDLRRPDRVRCGIDATPDAVVVATYAAEPAQIVGDDGVRAIVDWVDEGVCTGAILICDTSNRDRFDASCERAGCDEREAWLDRTDVSLDEPAVPADRDPATIAEDLLDAMDWNETQTPSRDPIDVEPVADQSTLAAVAGVPDNALDEAFLGRIVAETVHGFATTHRPNAGSPWLDLVDELVRDVGRNRCADSDEAIRFRGGVYGTAMAAIATADPTTDEWIGAIAQHAVAATNETATPVGRESIGGDQEPFATAFATALGKLALPGDETRVNIGAVACVDEALHEVVPTDGSDYWLHVVYGRTVGEIARESDDPATAEAALATIESHVRQHANDIDDRETARVLAGSFASMLGAIAGLERSPEELLAWTNELEARVRESATLIVDPDVQTTMLQQVYVGSIGRWAFEHDCPADRVGPWFEAVGRSLRRTAALADIDDSDAFVSEAYGQAVHAIVADGDLERAELSFAGYDRLVDAVAESDRSDDEWESRAALHADALAAFAAVEQDNHEGVRSYPYGHQTIPSEDALGFTDWLELYDDTVTRGAAADASGATLDSYLAAVYSGALSAHVRGFDADSSTGVTPRSEHTWWTGITDRLTVAATEVVEEPYSFLTEVYGDAAVAWANEGDASRSREWIASLVESYRSRRDAIDEPDRTAWFEAFAATDAAILAAVLTRTDTGERTHDRLVETVLSQIETAATAADNPCRPRDYAVSVFGTALARAADAERDAVRFGVSEVVATVMTESALEWLDVDRTTLLERIYGDAFAAVGREHADGTNADEWLAAVGERTEVMATNAASDDPSSVLVAVSARAVAAAIRDGADAWCRRVDSTLHGWATGSLVDDPETFLVTVYAAAIVEVATDHDTEVAMETCIDAVDDSIARATEAGLVRSDETLERTVSRAATALSTGDGPANATSRESLGRALRAADDRSATDGKE
ncbi:hypothetical protein [Natrinema thermotolerans]